MKRPRVDQALFSVAELAQLCGVSKFRMRRILRKHGLIKDEQQPRVKVVVLLVDLRSVEPRLVDSLLLRRAMGD